MKPEYLVRQWDILPPDKTKQSICVVGAGAIGSQVVMCLAKMGFHDITVFDDDDVSEENLNCQWYGPKDVGMPKVMALRKRIADMTGIEIKAIPTRIKDEVKDFDWNIAISAVDSMKSRTSIWKALKKLPSLQYLIDPRMSAEEGAIYTISLDSDDQMKKYENTFYTDEEAMAEACTAKSTMYCSMLISGQVAKTIKDLAVKDPYARTVLWNVKKNDVQYFN